MLVTPRQVVFTKRTQKDTRRLASAVSGQRRSNFSALSPLIPFRDRHRFDSGRYRGIASSASLMPPEDSVTVCVLVYSDKPEPEIWNKEFATYFKALLNLKMWRCHRKVPHAAMEWTAFLLGAGLAGTGKQLRTDSGKSIPSEEYSWQKG